MIRHVVMFRWADDVDDEHVASVASALDSLPAVIPEIDRYLHGSDLALVDGNHDYVVVADFESIDAYITYRDHPQHQAVIASVIAGRVAERASVQYEC